MGARWELTANGAVRCRVGREWHIQDSSVSIQEAFVEFNWARQTTWLKTLKNYSHEKKKKEKKNISPRSIRSKIEFSALSHVSCWNGDRASRVREGERSLNLLTFTACCSIKPRGQDRTLTRLSRDDKLAVLPDAWLPDLYSLSGGGDERGEGGGSGGGWQH